MIEIDGSYHEGGGQIVRTSVALSALTGTPVRITNIRAKRCNPGLSAQHLTCVLALADICGAKVSGAKIGSQAIDFIPGKVVGGKYWIDVGTAGAISLVLQATVLPAAFSGKSVVFEISGGTHVRWSPLLDYFSEIFCYHIRRLGIGITCEVKKHGFYPAGGGLVEVSVSPASELIRAEFLHPGNLLGVSVLSAASTDLRGAKVAERQAAAFEKSISEKVQIKTEYVSSESPGSYLFASALYENTRLGAGALGERGKPAEEVGRDAAEGIKKERAHGACLDEWMADQLLPYLALCGGKVFVAEITPHALTNMWVIERFFGRIFDVDEKSRTVAVPRPIKITA